MREEFEKWFTLLQDILFVQQKMMNQEEISRSLQLGVSELAKGFPSFGVVHLSFALIAFPVSPFQQPPRAFRKAVDVGNNEQWKNHLSSMRFILCFRTAKWILTGLASI